MQFSFKMFIGLIQFRFANFSGRMLSPLPHEVCALTPTPHPIPFSEYVPRVCEFMLTTCIW